jgi:hypothetical protein
MRRHEPNAKEFYGYVVTESLFEMTCQFVGFTIRGLVYLVCERHLLEIILGEQADLVQSK